jgi:predicted TIM-barrel fold metal-dependent hydrolase
MAISFFDCNTFMGSAQTGTWKPARGRAELLAAMDRDGIDTALAWHVGQQDWSIPEGNELLAREIGNEPRLWGCWTIVPPQTDELPPPAELFARMGPARIRALRIFPAAHNFVPGRTALGALLEGCVKRRIPLLLSVERGETGYPVIDRLLQEFPRLTCILCDIGVWGVDRFIRPLLERFPGVRVETSHLALHDGVLPPLAKKYGARRFVFGTGFPDRLPASAMLSLRHADIDDAWKEAIASGNLEQVLQEVKL